jgi:hypothetical protein
MTEPSTAWAAIAHASATLLRERIARELSDDAHAWRAGHHRVPFALHAELVDGALGLSGFQPSPMREAQHVLEAAIANAVWMKHLTCEDAVDALLAGDPTLDANRASATVDSAVAGTH